ncbi:unnamed protein product [Caenorhabditis sp. 36 PRJEB53466]|nr:unnamed protein product [Caenorhabditis sp. 36 PRJEB53466]
MRLLASLLILPFVLLYANGQSASKLAAMNNVKMDGKEVDRLQQMHYGWYIQAVSSLLGSVGKQLYMKMKKSQRRAFVACLDSIQKEYDVKSGAKCLVKAFDGKLEEAYGEMALDPKLDFIDKQDTVPMSKLDIRKLKMKKIEKQIVQMEAKKKARKIINGIQKEKIRLARFRKMHRRKFSGMYKMTPKMKEKMVKINAMKYRRRRMKRNILSLYTNKETEDEARRIDALENPFRVKKMDRMPDLKEKQKSPVTALTNMIREFAQIKAPKNMTSSYSNLKNLQDAVFGAREKNRFKNRMLDMVIGKNHPLRQMKSFTDRVRDITPEGMIDENVYGLVDAVQKHNKDTNANFLSPRFLPIMPEKLNTKKRLLSPDMFPLYRDESDNSILPIPTMLEKAGLGDQDRDNVLELVMDITGVNNAVDDALDLVKGLRKQGLDKDLVDITSLIDQVYSTISGTLTAPQNLDMANKKFSFMNKAQMETLYGEKGIYNTSVTDLPFDMNEINDMSSDEKEESIRMTIRELAKGRGVQGAKGKRSKRQTISLLGGAYRVVFLSPTVFSPMAFSPTINTLSVLGPLVISPQLFCPSVLSPLLMSLPVISPQVGNPLIFSPYVVGPNVLSAAVFNAYVFSPYVLSPNVINPYVLSPLILSPFVLCPDVLSPTILSGVVLSPSVLSPSIFTDSALAVNVLSPTFLS